MKLLLQLRHYLTFSQVEHWELQPERMNYFCIWWEGVEKKQNKILFFYVTFKKKIYMNIFYLNNIIDHYSIRQHIHKKEVIVQRNYNKLYNYLKSSYILCISYCILYQKIYIYRYLWKKNKIENENKSHEITRTVELIKIC